MFGRSAALVFGVAAAVTCAMAPAAQADTVGNGPPAQTRNEALGYGLTHPDAAPAGANDWACTPSADHPNPVVLVHGTWGSAYTSFARMAPELAAQGYCVYALNYGDANPSLASSVLKLRGTGPVAESSKELAAFVDRVRAGSGAEKVDIVGHSQGALVTRQFLRFDGGAGKVGSVVSLSGSNHGTTASGIGALGRAVNDAGLDVLGVVGAVIGRAAVDQIVGSPLLKALDAGGDTEPGVKYTVVATTTDNVVTPYATTFLEAGPGASAQNLTLQDTCPGESSDHSSVPYSPCAIDIVSGALAG